MITKRNGNGQTECYGCKEKGIFSLNWDSFLYNFNDKPYCFDCLLEKLEELNEENKQLKDLYIRTCNHLFDIGNNELARYFQAQINEHNTFVPQEIKDKEV